MGGIFLYSHMKRSHTKRPTTVSQQVHRLRERGMSIANETLAESTLLSLNYYRVRGYWITFEGSNGRDHSFKAGTCFEDVIALYRFDEDLRGCLLYYLGKLEISLRATFAYYLSTGLMDPLAYRREEHFKTREGSTWVHSESLEELDCDFKKSPERFAKHHIENYEHPPIWAVVEVMTFGQLSHWFKGFRDPNILDQIRAFHGIKHRRTFKRMIHSASVLRNICAHHGRLAHRQLSVLPGLPPKQSMKQVRDSWVEEERRAYNLLTLLAYVMQQSGDSRSLKTDLQALSKQYAVSLEVLGFPEDWESKSVWQESR